MRRLSLSSDQAQHKLASLVKSQVRFLNSTNMVRFETRELSLSLIELKFRSNRALWTYQVHAARIPASGNIALHKQVVLGGPIMSAEYIELAFLTLFWGQKMKFKCLSKLTESRERHVLRISQEPL